MLKLGSWYEEEGNVDEAARVYRELLEAVPDAEEARARLEAMGVAAPN
jgi:TolA-binding protein